jgi:hypothetical protein
MRPFPFTAAVLFPFAIVCAQRPDALFEHQKRATAITYGAVPVGQHSLTKLSVGQSWRLGMNQASTWRCDMPILAGDTLLAPGAYRVELERDGESTCRLIAKGSSRALGSNADGIVAGPVAKAGKPTKKLAIEWRKKGAAADGNQPAQIVVQFGEHEWVGDVTVLGHKEVKLGGWKGVVFAVPSDRVAAGPVPVATVSKGEHHWNVVLDKDTVKLVPWMAAPTEQFGFGEIVGPDDGATTTGKVAPLEVKVDKPRATVEPIGAKAEKGELVLDLGYAEQAVRLTLPEPKAKTGK